jgi:hypothetical protein
MPKKLRNSLNSKYSLDGEGCFVLENYNQAKAFSNFFPGIAGVWGVPMWVFFVNRGQCITSFGIEGKDKPIVEFLPANKAYRTASLQGFRTFVKVISGKKSVEWEPFQNRSSKDFSVVQRMLMTSHDLTIEEVNTTLGVICRINYFTVCEESFPALVRQVTFENISRKDLKFQVVDGLPVFLPYGMNDWAIKNMSRTIEAWVNVRNLEKRLPYYQLNVETADRPDVRHIKEGNFYFSFEHGKKNLLPVIAQPECVFGQGLDFVSPLEFFGQPDFSIPKKQQIANRTPCAMSYMEFSLLRKVSKTFVSMAGHAHSQNHLAEIAEKVFEKKYIYKKSCQNRDIVAGIKNYAFTHSGSPVFDQHTAQAFLDNVLRGGLPVSLRTREGNVAFNVFSRKHGDPERDYNYFILSPTYFSQGNGNYRDVNQNRRNDIWFNTDVAENSIITFFNLSQADGYNPLVVKGMSFFADDKSKVNAVLKETIKGDHDALDLLIEKGFQPGELLQAVEKNHIVLRVPPQEFLGKILSVCRQQTLADHGEGFWVDHWTYNIDLLESYLAIFPENLRNLLLEKKAFTFYFNDHYVLPRSHRYILTPNGVRQYHSVMDGSKSIFAAQKGHLLREEEEEGDVYYTDLTVKLLCLIANKAATLDPEGIGIEMEADKPGWYDALNGLPGLLGSSMCETFELQRYSQFLLDAFDELGMDDHYEIGIFDELGEFIKGLKQILDETDPLVYWDKANHLKENYRLSVRKGIRGDEEGVSIGYIRGFLRGVIDRVQSAYQKVVDINGLVPTYFTYEVTEYDVLEHEHDGRPFVLPRKFKKHVLPLFLEGIVHAMRLERDPAKARALYQAVRASALFDKALKMYKVNADISGESEDIGRARVFPRGWLENESIWLHMEYKYFLELLRAGLYREFYDTLRNAAVPFLDPHVYGRSVLENSSFIVSSAHEDHSLHGQGFVARLSGSTAEFVHMWLWMSIGQNPFVMNHQDALCLQFDPILDQAMFTIKPSRASRLNRQGKWESFDLPKNVYAFHFLASTLIVYHNPHRKDIFPDGDYEIEKIVLTYAKGKTVSLTDGLVCSPYAQDVRAGKVERIDVYFI